MMETLDRASLAQQLTKLGLVTLSQFQECAEEAANGDGPEAVLRVLERKGYLTPLQTDKLLKGDQAGYYLGGYRLLYKIASGSFGRVYRGDDPSTGRIVAIKVLRRRWGENPQSVELFEREARVGMSLRHGNIVEILAVGRDPATKQHYFVMEFVEGGNLREILAIRKKMELLEGLRIGEEMASALAYAFTRGITHRDLKLTNVLISSQGTSKLVDFGLAQIYSAFGKGSDDDAQMQRTVDYAGLERATGVVSGDTRSDIYFLGCILYEVLTGRSPLLVTRNKQLRMQKQRFTNVPPIRPEEIDGATSLIRLIETMMSLDPRQRFQTPAQLLEAIRSLRKEITAATNRADPGDSMVAGVSGPVTVFLVESDERLQDAIRSKLKELGYRVLIAANPKRAVERYAQQPFAGLIVDAGTTFQEGLQALRSIVKESHEKHVACHAILILSENQGDWVDKVPSNSSVTVFVRPLKLGQLVRKITEELPVGSNR